MRYFKPHKLSFKNNSRPKLTPFGKLAAVVILLLVTGTLAAFAKVIYKFLTW